MTLALTRETPLAELPLLTETPLRLAATAPALAPPFEPAPTVAPVPVPDVDEPDYERLQADVRAWRRTRHDDTDWEHQHESYLRYLDALVGERLDSRDTPAPVERLARALVYFTDRYPTTTELGAMLAVHEATGANVYDLALAWGIGWNPMRGPRRARITPPSDIALFALVEQAGAAVAATVRLLTERAGLAVVDREEVSSLAAVFALSLTGRCDCGHHVRGCTGCGRNCCFPDHDLRTWDPERCHLRPFVDQAVRGTAQRRIMGGAFAAGMLFRALEREGKLLCRTVEWGRCEDCGRAFEGLRCPEPHPHRPGSIRREPRKNQLVRPADGAGGHLPLQRWWCSGCHHLYGAAGPKRDGVDACPRCAGAPERRMTVWARVVAPAPIG